MAQGREGHVMTFGEKLKSIREAKGLTQAGLADASGIPLGTVRDYEQGRRDPLLSNAQKLAMTLEVSLDVFPATPGAESAAAKPANKRKRKPKGK
jgi:transcriptional regulator with XRE-family HTH domain